MPQLTELKHLIICPLTFNLCDIGPMQTEPKTLILFLNR